MSAKPEINIDINIDDPVDLCELILHGIVVTMGRASIDNTAAKFGDDLFPKIVGGLEKLLSWRGRRALRMAVRQGVARTRAASSAYKEAPPAV